MMPMLETAVRILSGLWCKWRHGGSWQYRGAHLHPAAGYTTATYYCPKCDGEVVMVKRLSVAQAQALYKALTAD